MMDQLASVGVEFDDANVERIFSQNAAYYTTLAEAEKKKRSKPGLKWAVSAIFDKNSPQRPWALGKICKTDNFVYKFSGEITRSPGLYRAHDRVTEKPESRFLQDTNERIHSSVRVRLATEGLGLNDSAVWNCPALKPWQLKRKGQGTAEEGKGSWYWEYSGDQKQGNPEKSQQVMSEEPLGPYEKRLLQLSAGSPNIWDFADDAKATA